MSIEFNPNDDTVPGNPLGPYPATPRVLAAREKGGWVRPKILIPEPEPIIDPDLVEDSPEIRAHLGPDGSYTYYIANGPHAGIYNSLDDIPR